MRHWQDPSRATSWWNGREAHLGAKLKFNRARDLTCYGRARTSRGGGFTLSGSRSPSSRAPVLLPLVPGGGRRALPAYAVLAPDEPRLGAPLP